MQNMSVLTVNAENQVSSAKKVKILKANVGCFMRIVLKLNGQKFKYSVNKIHWPKLQILCTYKIKYKTSF